MDRVHYAGIISILGIILIAVLTIHQPSAQPVKTLGGNAFQQAIANGGPLSDEPLPPLSVRMQIAGNTIASRASITVSENTIKVYSERDQPAAHDVFVLELVGSEAARFSTFSIGATNDPEGIAVKQTPLVATQADDGTWYTPLAAQQLQLLKEQYGSGWYVVQGTAHRASERATSTFSVFIQ